jgi:hypothetical protein
MLSFVSVLAVFAVFAVVQGLAPPSPPAPGPPAPSPASHSAQWTMNVNGIFPNLAVTAGTVPERRPRAASVLSCALLCCPCAVPVLSSALFVFPHSLVVADVGARAPPSQRRDLRGASAVWVP